MKTNGKRRLGRPRKLDDEKKDQVIQLISAGGSRKMASKFVGCTHTTLVDEAKRDPDFSARLTEAEGKAYAGYVSTVAKAAKDPNVTSTQLKAAQWMLARKYPEEFSELTRTAMTNTKGKDLTPQQRAKVIDAILEERRSLEAKG